MASNKKYWRGLEELNEDSSIMQSLQNNEFIEEIPTDEFLGDQETLEDSSTSRRDFLKFVGFSTAAASLAACEGPVIKSVPYVIKPEEITPGVANYYATAIADGYDFANILVKTREGRPIKIERNTLAKHNASANARVQASVLSLYDIQRVMGPTIGGENVTWSDFDQEVISKLDSLSGQDVVLLTQSFASPSTTKLIGELQAKYPNIRHVVYDTVSESEALDAFQTKFGFRALPDYDFAKADLIVSVSADFLGDWHGGGYDTGYAQGRLPKNGKMSRHVQVEANMSLTGANADTRIRATAYQQKQIIAALTGNGSTSNLPENIKIVVDNVKKELDRAGSKAVIVSGIADVEAQKQVLEFNLNRASEAIDVVAPRFIRQGSSAEVSKLIEDVKRGSVKGLITVGVDPLYSFPKADEFAEAYSNLDFTLAFAMKQDATATIAKYVAATPHYLESWGDLEMKKGHFSLMQPTINSLFDTRQFQDCIIKWVGKDGNYYDYIKNYWNDEVLNGAKWNAVLHDGVYTSSSDAASVLERTDVSKGSNLVKSIDGFELHFYTKQGLGDGRQANNPWLQEFPDPITRASWDNYLTISAVDANDLGLKNWNVANGGLNGSYVNLTVGDTVLENVPVLIQPGQAEKTIGLAFGYGATHAIQEEMQTGVNAYTLYHNFNSVQEVQIEKVKGEHEFACIQLHNTLMGRDIINETTLEIFNTKDVEAWNPTTQVSLDHEMIPVSSPDADLWAEFDREIGHHFNLSIDLNACTGCGACVIACHAENNVPVVGKSEIRRSRDMHWLRIDRYYSSEETFQEDRDIVTHGSGLRRYTELEVASANPQVAFQPVMCQHCNHAPCETVCPVAATSHGAQGQNHMAYNRCVGTRYCANNCPYKVRRFNWFNYSENDEFDYNMNNDLGRMVLNPDVVVRSRGVMEKCSLCIQMTQQVILEAKKEGRQIEDGEFQTACSAACNTGAMVFGDVNDEKSRVFEVKQDDRMYHLLDHLNTKPNVFYHTKVRNR